MESYKLSVYDGYDRVSILKDSRLVIGELIHQGPDEKLIMKLYKGHDSLTVLLLLAMQRAISQLSFEEKITVRKSNPILKQDGDIVLQTSFGQAAVWWLREIPPSKLSTMKSAMKLAWEIASSLQFGNMGPEPSADVYALVNRLLSPVLFDDLVNPPS